jgi:ATP-binding cassette subfamily B protein
MKLLLHYLKPYKWIVLLALGLAAINQIFSMLDPIIFGKMVDHFANHPHFRNGNVNPDDYKNYIKGSPLTKQDYIWGVLKFLGMLVAVAMVSRIAKAFQDYYSQVIVQRFGATIFTDGLKHSMGLPFSDFEDQRSGETLSILAKVRADTEKFILSFINVLFGIIVGVIFVSIWSFRLHWSIMPIYAVGMVILSWLTSVLSKKIKVIQKKITYETNALAGSTTESLRNIELVKSLGLTNQEIKRLNLTTFKILGLELRKVKSIRPLSFIQGTFVNFLRQSIMFLLMMLVFWDKLSPGELITMLFFSFFIFGPLQELGNIILNFREAEASLQNFHNLMEKPLEVQPPNPIHLGQIHNLTFSHVSFQHQTAPQKAVDNINFRVNKGETIAFVGPSGSGKTTLMKLIVGLYQAQEGTITYNNIDAKEIRLDDLRNQIGFVTQDTQLFSGSIKENMLFVKPEATDAELLDALHKASCERLLARAEKGLDTVIGEGGMKISGGEKQRLSIARALLRKPALLIFDEATSALDSITEESITGTIRSISEEGNQICVLIAHRLSTIMHADRIYVLEQGDVEEVGTHDSLLESKGLYYAMWRQQIGERKKASIQKVAE